VIDVDGGGSGCCLGGGIPYAVVAVGRGCCLCGEFPNVVFICFALLLDVLLFT